MSKARRDAFDLVKSSGKWKEAVQAYLASITFADAQMGQLLDVLEAGGYTENTAIVFWSDHGWHLGEKDHWYKFTLWDQHFQGDIGPQRIRKRNILFMAYGDT